MAKGKKRGRGLIIFLVILILAAAAGYYFVAIPYMEEQEAKKAAYNEALRLLEQEEYRLAYDAFLQLSDYEDAAAQAENVQQACRQDAQSILQRPRELADMGYNMLAGMYLSVKVEEAENYTVTVHNELVAQITEYYAVADQRHDETMALDLKLPIIPMLEFFDRLEGLGERKDPHEVLDILSEVTSPPIMVQLFKECWKAGFFEGLTLDQMAEACPYWVPIMDKWIAATEGLDVVELADRK